MSMGKSMEKEHTITAVGPGMRETGLMASKRGKAALFKDSMR